MSKVYYNPIHDKCRSEVGGAKIFAPQFFRVEVNKEITCEGMHLVIKRENYNDYNLAMKKVAETETTVTFEGNYTFLEAGLYWYHFSFWNGESTAYIGKGFRGVGEIMDHSRSWQLTCYEEGDTPEWFKGGVMYQIMVDRFNRAGEIKVRDGGVYHENWSDIPEYRAVDGIIYNNDFFGGNFEGIIEKLDYIKSLGTTVLYLNPIFEAESNHKYDTSDFSKIDEAFGGEEKFQQLIDECNKRDIKIILDGVFNHVGMESKYFNRSGKYDEVGAYQSKDSQYYDWFNFHNHPNDYESWWGIELLPSIRETSKSYVDYICGEDGIVAKWMKMGIGGFRLDVVDELPDHFLDKLVHRIKSINPDGVIIGEVWEDASNKVAYGVQRKYFTENQLDGVMNYPWKNAIISYMKTGKNDWLHAEFIELINNYPKKNLHSLMNILGTHDTKRILTALAGEDRGHRTREEIYGVKMTEEQRVKGRELLKMASVIQYTMPGVPSLYYADEAFTEGYEDPFNRVTYPWGQADEEMIAWYKMLGEIRKSVCFKDGDMELMPYEEGVMSYKRTHGDYTMHIVINNTENEYELEHKGINLLNSKLTSKVKPFTAVIIPEIAEKQ